MDTKKFTLKTIQQAADALKKGEVVAFPTETVYGLGADATNDEAVKKIYAAKGRPSDNPLISHVAYVEQVEEYAEDIPEKAYRLMEAFWPGPLTLVLKKKKRGLSSVVTAGLSSASFRMPQNETALELIRLVGKPLAAPSANTSGRPSPTTSTHVFHDLAGKIAGILDAGPATVGVESTVLDMTHPDNPIILRPGGITPEQIETVIGPINQNTPKLTDKDAPKSPGMKYQHYSPEEPVYVVTQSGIGWQEAIRYFMERGEKIGILASRTILDTYKETAEAVYTLGEGSAAEAARHLYAGLRFFEGTHATVILAEEFPAEGFGLAYMNRLEKAAGFKRI